MVFDLHTHTFCSDGVLAPCELISRAIEKGVDTLSITDHDTLDAYRDLKFQHDKINLVAGIELSTEWRNTGVHVLGLNVDINSEAMKTAVRLQSESRGQRALQIAQRLEKKGLKGVFEGASKLTSGSYVGRPHFARFLVESGQVDSISKAFKDYLGDGKAGDVRHHWAGLGQVIDWIRDARGIAVLAHPLKYKFTRTRLKLFLDDFIAAGGQGMEVVSGQQSPQQTSDMGRLCEQYGLLASCGSDFHMPGKPWAELGFFSHLPHRVKPVWESF